MIWNGASTYDLNPKGGWFAEMHQQLMAGGLAGLRDVGHSLSTCVSSSWMRGEQNCIQMAMMGVS
jgi:hypothetical protein